MVAKNKASRSKSTKVNPARTVEVDAERGDNGYSRLAGEINKDEFPVTDYVTEDEVDYADFGDDMKKGKVTKHGRQRAKIGKDKMGHLFSQIDRGDRPRVRPTAWSSQSAGGFLFDRIVKTGTSEKPSRQPSEKPKEYWNGAKHMKPACVIIFCVVAWGILALGENVTRFMGIMANQAEPIIAFDLAKLGNDTISVVLSLLVCLLWSTLCFKHVPIRRLWSWKPRVLGNGQSMMPGGFIPRPAAVSLGLLMFVTTVFIAEREVEGGALFIRQSDGSYKSHIGHGEWCRADVREESHYLDNWFSRLGRLAPLGCYFGPCPEGSSDPGCQAASLPSIPLVFETPLNASHMPFPNIPSPFLRTSHITVAIYHDFQRLFPLVFGNFHPDESLVMDGDHTCIYQCVKWKAYGFNTIVTKVGTIGAGNAIVTKMTETVTNLLGKKVTPDTTAENLCKLLEATRPDKNNRMYKFFHKSAMVPAFVFGGLRLFLAFYVYKIDDHGFFTVDYYVSQVLLFAIFTSIICRIWNIFRWEKYAFSDNLWTQGAEDFVIPDGVDGDALGSKPKSVDLFVWFHMSFEERAYLLIMYARKLPSDPTKWTGQKVQCFIEHSASVSFPGDKNVKETHGMRIKRGIDDDAWPQGTVTGKEGDMACVQWDEKHILVDRTHGQSPDQGKWFQDLKTYANDNKEERDPWLEKDPKIEQYKAATTTKIHPMYLFDQDDVASSANSHTTWDSLLKRFIGSVACQDQVRGKILWRLRTDENLLKLKGCCGTRAHKDVKTDEKKKADEKKKNRQEEQTKNKQKEHYDHHHKDQASSFEHSAKP